MPKPTDPLAGAIWELVNKYGSHDKFAEAVGVTRTTAINWEKGGVPKGRNRDALVGLGLSEDLWPENRRRGGVDERFDHLEQMLGTALKTQTKVLRNIQALAQAVDRIHDLVEDALPEASSAPKRRRRTG